MGLTEEVMEGVMEGVMAMGVRMASTHTTREATSAGRFETSTGVINNWRNLRRTFMQKTSAFLLAPIERFRSSGGTNR